MMNTFLYKIWENKVGVEELLWNKWLSIDFHLSVIIDQWLIFHLKQSRLYDEGKHEPGKEFQRDAVCWIKKLLEWLSWFLSYQLDNISFVLAIVELDI